MLFLFALLFTGSSILSSSNIDLVILLICKFISSFIVISTEVKLRFSFKTLVYSLCIFDILHCVCYKMKMEGILIKSCKLTKLPLLDFEEFLNNQLNSFIIYHALTQVHLIHS